MNKEDRSAAFTEIALERRAIRNYDETVDISRAEMSEILEMATKAPSSSNMQPWRFVVVNRPQIKEMLLPYAQFNQRSIGSAAAVIAIFADLDSVQNAETIMQKTDELQKEKIQRPPMPANAEGKNPRDMIIGMLSSLPREQRKNTALIDCGLVTMQLMQAARVFGYDTCPLGAFDRAEVSQALDMESERYEPVMLLTIGKAAETGRPSYRLPIADIAKFYE